MDTPRIHLRDRRARPSFGRHPWIFEKSIDHIEGRVEPGAAVAVYSKQGQFIAHGLFNPNSAIRVRLYSWQEDRPIHGEWIATRVRQAIDLRHRVLGLGGERQACRLVYSESDGLSGLIVDRFAHVVNVQINSLGLSRFEPEIVEALWTSLSPRSIHRRVDSVMAEREGLQWRDELLRGEPVPGPIVIEDFDGIEMWVDPTEGQKTGAYLDQRENRKAVARFSAGRDVLDVFCYSGGFGLAALKSGRARSAMGVDSSAQALEIARRNSELMGLPLELRQGDAAAVMTDLARAGRRFGVVVCDPPKFAQRAADVEGALRGYEYINRLAINVLEPGGILATCSCSGLVTREMFLAVLAESSRKEGRELRILEIRGQAPDHPISLSCPETEYLKCVIAHVP